MMFDGMMSTDSGSSMEPVQVATNSSSDTCKHMRMSNNMLFHIQGAVRSPKLFIGSAH